MIDVEAIRARNEERGEWCPLERGGCGARADIDALLAEVERLQHIVNSPAKSPVTTMR